jgi:hypothetical protein
MAGERRVTFRIETESGGEAFNLFFRSQDRDPWTGLHTTDATPAAPEDLPVSLALGGVYRLDGVNGPTGNMAAASRGGNAYQVRLKTAGGYGNWSPIFAVEYSPDVAGPLANVQDLIDEFGANRIVFKQPENAGLHRLLGKLLTYGMDRLRLDSGIRSLYESATRTDSESRMLGYLECLFAIVRALRHHLAPLKALGAHAPLWQEDSSNIRALATDIETEAKELLAEFEATVPDTVPAGPALPYLITGTFDPGTLTIPPSRKIMIGDERDDVPAGYEAV